MLNNVADVAALNDYEGKITLNKPQASLLDKTPERSAGRAMTIVDRRAIEAGDGLLIFALDGGRQSMVISEFITIKGR